MRQHLHSARLVTTTVVVTFLTACSALDVNAPTTVRLGEFDNAAGAALEVNGIRSHLTDASRSGLFEASMLSDEFLNGNGGFEGFISTRDDNAYKHVWVEDRGSKGLGAYSGWQKAWLTATSLLPHIRQFAASGPNGIEVADALAYRGYAMLMLAEQICPGFPLADVEVNGEQITPKYTSVPLTTDSAFKIALADFDSAIAYAGDTGQVRYRARIWRGRALLGLGRGTEAAGAVQDVPTDFADSVFLGRLVTAYRDRFMVMNRKGMNGIDYVTAHDPRVAFNSIPSWCGDGCLFGDSLYSYKKYIDAGNNAYLTIASGLEARLIEAEGQLASGGAWLNTLNALRANVALADTTDPGTSDARVNLLFRERAFWLFASGRRLGDMRRLVARYGRDPETVFPTGDTPWEDYGDGRPQYGVATAIPFDGDFEHQLNPKITGCTAR
jgi:starch-binding outer membrane protein, SusD/RagB family